MFPATLKLALVGGLLASVWTVAPSFDVAGLAHAWLGECEVHFDNEFALENVYAQARSTFAVPTGLADDGDREPCDESHLACWTYRHRCFGNYVNVEPINYGHFHLSFQDFEQSCFVDPGDGLGSGFGRPTGGGGCAQVNYVEERRFLDSHVADHWIKIFLEDRVSHEPRVFDIARIWVHGDQPIQFWFKKTDGTWWYWSSLGPRTKWDLSDYANDLIEVRIRGADAATGHYTIRGFILRD